MRKNMQLMFERSDQAVLLLDKAVICYANPRAQKLLGFDPTNAAIVDLFDFKFAKECFSFQGETVTYHKNVRIQNQCLHASRVGCNGYTLLFLYLRKEPRFAEDFLHDTLLSLLSQMQALPAGHQKREMETLSSAALAITTPTCTLTDFHSFLTYTLSHFTPFIDGDRLEIELEEFNAPVFLYTELMHLTLVWVILDLLKIAGPSGTLKVSCKCDSACARLCFKVQHASCPQELLDILFGTVSDDITQVFSRHGSALFRAKRVFSLHDSTLEYSADRDGFLFSAGLAFADAPASLYAPILGLTNDWSVTANTIQSLIRSYFEEA